MHYLCVSQKRMEWIGLLTCDTFWRSSKTPLHARLNPIRLSTASLSAEHLKTAALLLGTWDQGRPVGASHMLSAL